MDTPLYRFQSKDVNRIEKLGGRVLLASEMGTGKTLVSLAWAKHHLPNGSTTVVICPASVKWNWQREAARHVNMRAEILSGHKPPHDSLPPGCIYIINYDILLGSKKQAYCWLDLLKDLQPELVVVDECFLPSAAVLTDKGSLSIGEIVNNELPVKVACWDHDNNSVVYRSITHYIKKRRDTRLVTIHHSGGDLVCTENHEVWTENRGYVKAGELLAGDQLRMVWNEFPEEKEQSEEVLYSSMRTEACGETESRKASPRFLEKDEGTQSDEEEGNHREDGEDEASERNTGLEERAGRQRQAHSTRDETQECTRQGLEVQPPDHDRHGKGNWLSNQLQGGRWKPQAEDRCGDRWSQPQATGTEETRPQETEVSRIARVVSVEVHESIHRLEAGICGGDDSEYVYCLEVEEHHNFFADEVLVHNCHYIKSLTAKRTKAVMELCKEAPHVIMISGTPLTSKPAELFPAIHTLCPDEFPSFRQYAWRYCRPRRTHWGWEFKGAENLDELHQRLNDSCMIRRRKCDVLKDLPAKTRTVVPMELSDADKREYFKAEKEFISWLRKLSPQKARSAEMAEYLVKRGYLKRLAGILKQRQVISWLEDFLQESGEKLIFFGVHKKFLKPIYKHFTDVAVHVDGNVTGRKRQNAFDAFTNLKKKRLLIGNIHAAGVGWNGQVASHVAFGELDWLPGIHTQAEDRAHRMGQLSSVTCHYLVAKGTIEEKLCSILQERQKVLTQIMDGTEDVELDIMKRLEKMLLEDRR